MFLANIAVLVAAWITVAANKIHTYFPICTQHSHIRHREIWKATKYHIGNDRTSRLESRSFHRFRFVCLWHSKYYCGNEVVFARVRAWPFSVLRIAIAMNSPCLLWLDCVFTSSGFCWREMHEENKTESSNKNKWWQPDAFPCDARV